MQETYDGGEKNWVLGITALASFMVALDALVMTTGPCHHPRRFRRPVETLQWTVNAFNLSFRGAAADRRRARRPVRTAPACLPRASPCSWLASVGLRAVDRHRRSLIAARAAQGAGAALVMPLGDGDPERRLSKGRARPGARHLQRRHRIRADRRAGDRRLPSPRAWDGAWIFWINLPIGIVAIAWSLTRLRESFGPAAALDIPGLVLVAAAAFALVWGLLRGNGAGWTSAEVIDGARSAGSLLAAAFVAWELRATAPMVPMRLFRVAGVFRPASLASFLFYAAMYGVLFLLPQFLQTALGFGPLGAGLRLLPWTATLFVTAPVAGALVNKFGERPLVVTGLADAGDRPRLDRGDRRARIRPIRRMVAPLILAGVGVSMAMPAAQNAVLSSVAVDRDGQGLRRLQHGPVSRRHVRHRRFWSRSSPRTAASAIRRGFQHRLCRGHDGCGRALAARRIGRASAAGAPARCRRADSRRTPDATIGFRYRSIGKHGLGPDRCK